jgi:hypothetical protein
MDALYFPHLSLPPSTWVNPALLFFDRLGVIAPDGGGPSLHDRRTHELIDLNMVWREVPGAGWEDHEDHALLSYLLGLATATRDNAPIVRVHAGKLAYGMLAEELIRAGLLARGQDRWLEGPEWVVAHLMSYLALQISAHAEMQLPLITDQGTAAQVMVGPRQASLDSRRLRAVTRLLAVPPDARLADIASFRERHSRELRSFRNYITALITRDPADATGGERFEERLREAREVRAHLVGEMESFNWRESGIAIAITALSTGAARLDHAPWTVGAGLVGLGLIGMQALSARDRRRRAEGSRLVYAAKVSRRWPGAAASTLW